jgi:hypothetical protein
MFFKKKPFKLGNSVRFKDGEKDEDSGIEIGGWQGRIIEINEKQKMLLVALDSITLKSLSREYLEACEEEGLGWSEYYIEFHSVELAQPRDTKKVVEETIAELSDSLGWVYIGEEGREINAILAGANYEYEQMEAWEAHLRKILTFPFEAKISEWQKPATVLQVGQKVRVMGIDGLDELYGVLVKIKKGGRAYTFPLCDLEVVAHNSPNRDPVQLYAIWFANR